MRLTTSTLFFLIISAASAQQTMAKEWRGIVPLHSTRSDVVRLYNQCADPEDSCEFVYGNEEVYIVFSSGAMSEYHECAKKLPRDTVLLVEVELKHPVRLKGLRLDRKEFRTFDPSSPPNIGYKGYIDQKEGLIIKTYKGKVLQFDHIATGADTSICPSYYESPESFIQLLIEMCCPPLIVNCPDGAVAGQKIIITAATLAVSRAVYKWKVSGGKIVAGQGTLKITVDTTGLSGQSITASLEMHGGKTNMSTVASCQVFVAAPPNN